MHWLTRVQSPPPGMDPPLLASLPTWLTDTSKFDILFLQVTTRLNKTKWNVPFCCGQVCDHRIPSVEHEEQHHCLRRNIHDISDRDQDMTSLYQDQIRLHAGSVTKIMTITTTHLQLNINGTAVEMEQSFVYFGKRIRGKYEVWYSDEMKNGSIPFYSTLQVTAEFY